MQRVAAALAAALQLAGSQTAQEASTWFQAPAVKKDLRAAVALARVGHRKCVCGCGIKFWTKYYATAPLFVKRTRTYARILFL